MTSPLTLREIPRWFLVLSLIYLAATDFHPAWITQNTAPKIHDQIQVHAKGQFSKLVKHVPANLTGSTTAPKQLCKSHSPHAPPTPGKVC